MTVRGTELATQAAPHPRMDRRRFLLTSLAGAVAAPLAAGTTPNMSSARKEPTVPHEAHSFGNDSRDGTLSTARRRSPLIVTHVATDYPILGY